jgi:hypothetical protein
MSRVAPGRVVLYRLTDGDVVRILSTRAEHGQQGNGVEQGQEYPALIVRVWDTDDEPRADGLANLKVQLDGDDTLWVTSRTVTDALDGEPGTYRFPVPEAVRPSP